MDIQARMVIDAHDVIGEGPVWDSSARRLIWSDNELGVVHEATADGLGGWRERRCWNLGRPLAAAIPRSGGGLVVTGGIDVFLLDEAGVDHPFTRLNVDPQLVRINDAKCDRRGRLWAGTLANDFSRCAGLYRIDPDGSVETVLTGLRLANGLAWSPDDSTFYFIDSLSQAVDAFDFDVELGSISRRRTCVRIERGAPNGMTVDSEGCLWVAVTGAGEVRRYTPEGQLIGRVGITTPGATSCAFGGPRGEELFITSLGRRMPEIARELGLTAAMMENNRPESGGVFVCRPGVAGEPATPFAG